MSDVDETAVELAARSSDPSISPAGVVLALAAAKGDAVASSIDADGAHSPLVLACDSVLEVGGRVVGKPLEATVARERWRAMRGGTGVLHTGHWVQDLSTRESVVAAASARLRFGDLSDAEIDGYVATGEPLHVAGGFTIDGLGSPFVEVVEGDASTVIGLSLPTLRQMLLDLGVGWWDVADGSTTG